jgi:uncharacterized repeat protein (TIGR03803 family)
MAKLNSFTNACVILVVYTAAIAASAQTFTVLHTFSGPDGSGSHAGLIQAADGNFYGTTAYGGAYDGPNGGGTVFKITPAGTLTSLYSFCAQIGCPDGNSPTASLIQATDGNFYGTTEGGGSNNCQFFAHGCGTIFKITAGGTLTTLYSFCAQIGCPDGAHPRASLMQATDGNLYGTTSWGGANQGDYTSGTVFRITTAGVLTTLHSFDGTDGGYPWAGLIQADDGNFFGATTWTVFRISPGGALTTLSTSLVGVLGGLIQADDGNFYGTTQGGGAYGNGTVFKITPTGALTTLYSFCPKDCSDGEFPEAALAQGTDGNFYGTTWQGGWRQNGTVFEISAGGTLGTLHRFESTDGAAPAGRLIQATDGRFYGTTLGTVFRLSPTPAVSLPAPLSAFGNQALAETSAERIVPLKNSGTALLNMSGVSLEGSSFAISANACAGAVLAMGKTCNVSVTFTPTVLGKLIGTLTFTDNASNSPQTVPLLGMGVEPAKLMLTTAWFGMWAVGATSTVKTFTLTNYQSVTLSGIAISTTGDFAVSATTCTTTLAARRACTVSVNFTPTALGKRTGTLSVSDSASNSPQTSALTGTGALPAALTPPDAAFGIWAVGTTSTDKTFTLTNNQSVTLSSIAISTTGDFAVSATTCTTSLAAQSKCTISVSFTPTALGKTTATLSVSDSASNSPQTSNLAGTGN